MNAPITLDQLHVLIAVVEAGSFSAAGRRLRRTQGAISYNIQALEQQLGVILFDRSGRVPSLTPAGHAILREAGSVLESAQRLRATASAVRSGIEPTVSLVVDVLFPSDELAEVAQEFGERFPTAQLDLRTAVLSDVTNQVRTGTAHLGVCGAPSASQELVVTPCGTVRLEVVASPKHPLAHHAAPIDDGLLREHTNIVLSDSGPPFQEGTGFALGLKVWRVNDAAIRNTLLRKGLGWARVPSHQIQPDLANGSLLRLHTKRWPNGIAIPLHTIYRLDDPPGPAGTWLLGRLRTSSAESPPSDRQD